VAPFRAPRLRAHTELIAQLAGLTPQRIAELREQGIFK
jgi:hypothetical protein